jgi:AMP deaminase
MAITWLMDTDWVLLKETWMATPETFYTETYRFLARTWPIRTSIAMVNSSDPELSFDKHLDAMFGSIEKCVQIRAEYMAASLQRPGDNPKDKDSWEIYPKNWGIKGESPQDFDFSLCSIPPLHDFDYRIKDGVFHVYKPNSTPLITTPDIKKYYQDLDYLQSVVSDGPTRSFAFRRLRYLDSKFQMYVLLNEYQEMAESKKTSHRDFYNVRKVDCHVHHTSCMNQKHLLRFIKYKLRNFPDDVVIFRDGQHLTLQQVFDSLHLTPYDLSIDTLDMHAHTDTFHRFDKFNLKYNPIGESRLREIFLKTDNYINGRYLAELTKEVISDLEASKYQMVEWRVSIYGRSRDEWDKLSRWVVNNKLFSHTVRWVIQTPRLYNVYKSSGQIECFQDMITSTMK